MNFWLGRWGWLGCFKGNGFVWFPYVNNLAWSCLGAKQYDKAILLWTEHLERNPDSLFAFQGLIAAYEWTGNTEKAHWAAENVMRLNPKFTIARMEKTWPIRDEAFLKRYFEALRSTGLKWVVLYAKPTFINIRLLDTWHFIRQIST